MHSLDVGFGFACGTWVYVLVPVDFQEALFVHMKSCQDSTQRDNDNDRLGDKDIGGNLVREREVTGTEWGNELGRQRIQVLALNAAHSNLFRDENP